MKRFNLNKFNSTKAYLKSQIKQWKKDSLKKNRKCAITGVVHGVEVHHHNMSFNLIFKETFEVAGIEYREYTYQYTQEELTKLSNTILALHYKYGLGIAIAPFVHKALHETYGPTVTPEQYKEFKQRYKSSLDMRLDLKRKIS